jgi:hypothetical protein
MKCPLAETVSQVRVTELLNANNREVDLRREAHALLRRCLPQLSDLKLIREIEAHVERR